MLYIVVTDAVSVTGVATINQFYLLISTSEGVAVTSLAWVGYDTVEVYDSVSILDSPIVAIVSVLRQYEASKAPVISAKASFARVFTSSQPKLPVRSGLGYFGARLSEKRIPLRTISANIADPDIGLYGGSNYLPVYSMSGSFGMRLNRYIPLHTLEASFDLAGIFSLDTYIPVRTLSAAFRYPDSFTLSRQIPIWIGQGSLILNTYAATLSGKIPGAFVLTGTLRDSTGYGMSAYIPVWRLESSMYQSSFSGGSVIPVIFPRAIVYEENRFSDYVLRYNRA